MMMQKLKKFFSNKVNGNFIGFDKYRKRGAYHWEELESNADYRALIRAISEFTNPEQVVLDVGCGDGAYLGQIAPRVKQAWGIDADVDAARLANEKLQENNFNNCNVRHLRIDQAKQFFAHNKQKFDLVWSADVIEHLPRPEELLELAVQVLNPSALCLIGTPIYISDELKSPYHVKEYTIEEINSIISTYLNIQKEIILPHSRKDGKVYEEGYYLAVCRLP